MPSYGLKYYAEFQNIRNQKYNIGVYERDFQGTAKIMGDLCGCDYGADGSSIVLSDVFYRKSKKVSKVRLPFVECCAILFSE